MTGGEDEDDLEVLIADLLNKEIRLRDKMELELKLEFIGDPRLLQNHYSQEFYFFIPQSLQVTPSSYSKDAFYLDQTSLIRFKTPILSFSELLDRENHSSPLFQVETILKEGDAQLLTQLVDELKLTANVVRSTVRRHIGKYVKEVDHNEYWHSSCLEMLEQLSSFRKRLTQVQKEMKEDVRWVQVAYHADYVDEFVSLMVSYHLAFFLKHLREGVQKHVLVQKAVEQRICEESAYREAQGYLSRYESDPDKRAEYQIYRKGLLKKYMLTSLQLNVVRQHVLLRYQNFVGALAAALAMVFYLLLLVYWGTGFLWNSAPFVSLSVLLYVLKDRIKEWVKQFFSMYASKWFPDYDTVIYSEDDGSAVGRLKEYVSWVELSRVPPELMQRRNKDFHTELEKVQRMERVLYYSRGFTLYSRFLAGRMRRFHINNILRFNIQAFTRKASSAYQPLFQLNTKTGVLEKIICPKVYHINVIMLTRTKDRRAKQRLSVKEFRVILDKNGIKRVESIKV